MRKTRLSLSVVLALSASAAGCRQDMHDQNKLEPLEASPFFGDRRGSRQPVEGTVARGHLDQDRHFFEGRSDAGGLVDSFPMPITTEVILRGRERYDIFC